jgi:transaldolase
MKQLKDLKVKIFSDGADKNSMLEMNKNFLIKGLTTNPTLMKRAGVNDYESFCKDILLEVREKPISFEVFSDDFKEMYEQAIEISQWGENVYVKIPITNTKKKSSEDLIKKLSTNGVKLNITAITTLEQIKNSIQVLNPSIPSYISVFAGRIADTGIDPVPMMKEALLLLESMPKAELIWASPRETLNIFQADEIGCHIITVTTDILKKMHLIGKNLEEYSLETVTMFHNDAVIAGYKI